MERMGFGFKFLSWIDMLHSGARTRFILAKLTDPIDVAFSIRQGDPLAMLLYIIYVEPLLVYIEKRISCRALQVLPPQGFQPQKGATESYCDDINVMTTNEQDLCIVDEGVRKFEVVSGAILSRNRKCKILGVGRWSRKNSWALDYVQTAKEIKVFGIFLLNSYVDTLKRNWDFRFRKFEQAVHSWSSRFLEHLNQRVEVLKTFALSRVYYVASVLPLSKTIGKKFEKLMGKFIWSLSGKILRVSINELKLPVDKGGLGLTCVVSMAESLLLTQLLRLLKYGDQKSITHVSFWLGEILKDISPSFDQGIHPSTVSLYFQSLACVIADARIRDVVTADNWKNVTNKVAYNTIVSTFSLSKVEIDAGVSLSVVWSRLGRSTLSAEIREVLFLLVHNKLPTQERLFRIRSVQEPYCERCNGKMIGDLVHYFCLCNSVANAWNDVKNILDILIQGNVSDFDLINLRYSKCQFEEEVIWVIGSYVHYVWRLIHVEGKHFVDRGKLFGFLKFKYRCAQLGHRTKLNIASLSS